jgi:hypothetical protein
VKYGKPTVEPGNLHLAIRPLSRLYGQTDTGDFGPLAMTAVRRWMIDAGLCRRIVGPQSSDGPSP